MHVCNTGGDSMDERQLLTIRTQFLAMVPVRSFMGLFDNSRMKILLSPESQIAVLEATVKSDVCKKYPPSLKYQQSFLKSLIQTCEASDCEPVDELYESYTTLLSHPQPEPQTDCYRSYILPGESCAVTLKESVSLISQGTTGLNTWPAAGFLIEWALENKEVFRGRVVLELGSGMGLTGLGVCKACHPAHYVFSDCHPSVLRGLRENITINVPGTDLEEVSKSDSIERNDTAHEQRSSRNPSISVESINWEAVEDKDVQKWNPGVILAADVVYDTRIIEPLVRLLRLLLNCQGDGRGRPTAFVASTIRNEETYSTFLAELEKQHVVVEKVPGPSVQTLHYDRSCPIQLLCLRAET